MLSWFFLGLLTNALGSVHAVEKLAGVHPSLLSKYVPSSGDPATWKCLDGSKVIRWSSVNDDYCDCPDGSDEPGKLMRMATE